MSPCPQSESAAISMADVLAAAVRLSGHVERTPLLRSASLDTAAGMTVLAKAECHQTTGAFKLRGATNAVLRLSPTEREAGLVAYSSGNHAQAVARAARRAGTSAVIVMPHDAPVAKVDATEAEGARLVRYDRYTEDRAAIAAAIAADEGRVLIPPFDHPDVMAGQGTVGLELVDQVTEDGARLDAVVVPVGGGGLLAGVATAVAARAPEVEIYGVEPRAGDDHVRSRQAGCRVDVGVPDTIADGQQVATPGELTWPINNGLATDFVSVTDEQIAAAMAAARDHLDVVLEPSGASGLAAVLDPSSGLGRRLAGRTVAVVLSGGNVDPDRYQRLVGG